MKFLFLLALLSLSCLGFAQHDSIPHDLLPPKDEIILDPTAKKEPFIAVEQMPVYPEGEAAMMRFIAENLVYPDSAIKKNIEGVVRIKFTVSTTGEIKDPMVLNKNRLGYGCEEAAMAVVMKMPKWIPGKQNGVPVEVYYNLPFRFRLY
jgi:protein TonB